jgi:HSF-type DNA-binding
MILHRLLHDMEREADTQRIISWDPDGKSFTVHQPQLFVEQIMGQYFTKQTFYKSFQVRMESSQKILSHHRRSKDPTVSHLPHDSDNSISTSSKEQNRVLVSTRGMGSID